MSEEIFEKIRESEYGANNIHITRIGDTLLVELTYPNVTETGVKFIEIDQESVRASDGIRLTYDYHRDGWSIMQPTKTCWDADDEVYDEGWKEVAFIQSWALRAEQIAHAKSLGIDKAD